MTILSHCTAGYVPQALLPLEFLKKLTYMYVRGGGLGPYGVQDQNFRGLYWPGLIGSTAGWH